MRLIELRLKNLNSLKGEWHIDFTDPAFVNEGIFAITGQTGAGKTTILDAICLALYSQTPRLGEITGSSNEMMTQGTGECSAEVLIEIGDKIYRCSWYQHRAYKKAKGKLSGIKHEISDAKTGDILEDAKSKTTPFIQELIGMDFNQFTRSIMLAQGSFAAFLKSDTGDRAAILEKITGTAIYAEISKNVFEKKRFEEGELAKLQAGVDSLPLLSSQDEAQLLVDLSAHQETQLAQRLDFKTVTEQLQWLDKVADLKRQSAHYQTTVTNAAQDAQSFIPELARLEAANKALEIDSPFSQLVYSRNTAKRLNGEHQDLLDNIPAQQAALDKSTIDLHAAIKYEAQAADELHDSLPIIAKVRELDADIKQQAHALADDDRRKTSLSTNIQQLKQEISGHQENERQAKSQLTTIAKYLSTHHELTDLDTDIATFNSSCSRLKTLLQNNTKLSNDKLIDQNTARQLKDELTQLYNKQAKDKSHTTEKREQLSGLQQQQADLLQDNSLNEMRDQQEQIDTVASQLDSVSFKLQSLNELATQIKNINSALPTIKQALISLKGFIRDDEGRIKDIKLKREEKQAHLNLLQKVAKLEDYIAALEDDKPCPLCGATEHPYARNHPLLDSDAQNEHSITQQTQQQLIELDELIDGLEKTLAQHRIEQATKQNNLEREQQQLTSLTNQAKALCHDIQTHMKTVLDSNNSYCASISTIIKPFKQISADINTFIDTLDQQINLNEGTINIEIITNALSLISAGKQNLTQEKATRKVKLTQYDTFNQTITEINKALEANERQQQTLSDEISNLSTDIKLNTQKVEGTESTLAANFSELAEVIAAVVSVVHKYPISKYEDDSNTAHTDSTTKQSLELLVHSIDDQAVLNEIDCNNHIDGLRQQRSALLQLKQNFIAQKDNQQTLQTTLNGLSAQITTKQAQLDGIAVDFQHLVTVVTDKKAAVEQLRQTRIAQFADKNSDDEENRLRALLDKAKTVRATMQRQQDNAKQALEQRQDRVQQLANQLDATSDTLKAQEDTFVTLLAQSQFTTEADFESARLPKESRDELKQRQTAIDYALNQAKTQLNSVQHSLNEQLANPLTSEQRETLASKHLQLQTDIETRLGETGAIEQQLRANEQQKGAQASQHIAINAQKENMQVWQQLYDLIGSADGKKYRTFAQGLTFQVMISHANTQLQKMSDRYLLIHDDNNPLELNVIDNYQGGDVRSTKNLSGGEGFIISLALALGLSQMASQNIRVDSLFLDEGFGTLDEESLDIALDTLTSLQQEGKLIGIISHVQALKERIMTQIQVTKISGGFSEITGQGCYKITS
ncbi:exonuclease SbcC [Psychrobacter sp. PL15]|uniref:AAA family ATPase n=1 Tax=Psychrobacter sp. PL15 TaxID=3071719 RepID=UPI002DF99BB0|nr:exonuclease SbcC [Psychrobacter sp. PL15]